MKKVILSALLLMFSSNFAHSVPMKSEAEKSATVKALKAEQGALLEDLAISTRRHRNYATNLEQLKVKRAKDPKVAKNLQDIEAMLNYENKVLSNLRARNLEIETEISTLSK